MRVLSVPGWRRSKRRRLQVQLRRQGTDFHIAEIYRMALGLQREVAAVQHQVAVANELLRIAVTGVELRALIFQDGFPVDAVNDAVVAMNLNFGFDPLFAVKRRRAGVDAVWRKEFALHDHMRAGCAKIARGTRILTVATEKLHFDGNGKILILAHAGGKLGMNHHPTVAERPARSARRLPPNEAVFKAQHIV